MEQRRQESEELGTCLIKWRGQNFIVEINQDAALKELGEKLLELTNVRADTLRLLVPVEKSSKMFYPFSEEHSRLSLDTTSLLKGKSIRMMGVPKDEVDEILQNAKTDLRIAGFDEEERRLRKRNSDRAYTSRKLPQGTYIFCDFRTLTLPGIELNPPALKAMELLHMLASDPGIVAIMNKHRWRVGILTEMAPIGYVGVSPRCILGVNKNQGEEISLRLRTDDLKGFRKYDSIKKTLLHELAHMVFSEHDAKFYALNSQLNKEAAALDWTKSRGHSLSGAAPSQNYDVEFDDDDSGTGSQKLGGQAPIFPNARMTSVNAAFQRLANTSNAHPDSSEELTDVESAVDDAIMADSNNLKYENIQEHDQMDSSGSTGAEIPSNLNSVSSEPEPESNDSQIQVVELVPDSSEAVRGIQTAEPETDNPELQIIQDPVTILCSRMQNAIQSLKYEVIIPSESGAVLQTLIKIIRNVIEHPNETKFKKLRKANATIQRNIVRYKAAMDILVLVGFCDEVIFDEFGNKENFLVLKRNDPGLLWLAKSTLETYIS